MPFDETEIPELSEIEQLRSEPRGFAPDEMVTCETCLRANPPTRTSCLYCAAQLPVTEATAALQRPTLRRLEKWEQGFNTILLTVSAADLTEASRAEMASLLRLEPDDLKLIVEAGVPLPLARAAAAEEASLLERKFAEMGVRVISISDNDLMPEGAEPKRARAFELGDELMAYAGGGGQTWHLAWTEVSLIVVGRLFTRQVEVEERKGRREGKIIDAREVAVDEAVLDIYATTLDGNLRVTSSSFDYSCLGQRKSLLTAQNFSTLISLLRERAGHAAYDDSYNRVRRALAVVWPLEQQSESRGWRRQGPGRVNTEEVTRSDNETQFTRYSHLLQYLRQHRQELFG